MLTDTKKSQNKEKTSLLINCPTQLCNTYLTVDKYPTFADF